MIEVRKTCSGGKKEDMKDKERNTKREQRELSGRGFDFGSNGLGFESLLLRT